MAMVGSMAGGGRGIRLLRLRLCAAIHGDVPMTEIVAEISGNHGGSLYNALRLIRAAADVEADAVKFQCFEPERLAEKRSKTLRIVELAKDFHGRSLIDLYREIHTPKEWFPDLIRQAEACGLRWFSSVF